jgi:hypothetical protein
LFRVSGSGRLRMGAPAGMTRVLAIQEYTKLLVSLKTLFTLQLKAYEPMAMDSRRGVSFLASRRLLQDRSELLLKFSKKGCCRWPPFCRFAEDLHPGPSQLRLLSWLPFSFPALRSGASRNPWVTIRRMHAWSASVVSNHFKCILTRLSCPIVCSLTVILRLYGRGLSACSR